MEPQAARGDLAAIRLLVQATLAGRTPFEVFDGVGEEDSVSVDASVRESLVEDASRWSDERLTGEVLPVARLLSADHDLPGPPALAAHGLGPFLPEGPRSARRGSRAPSG